MLYSVITYRRFWTMSAFNSKLLRQKHGMPIVPGRRRRMRRSFVMPSGRINFRAARLLGA